jgi:hypothetical protein
MVQLKLIQVAPRRFEAIGQAIPRKVRVHVQNTVDVVLSGVGVNSHRRARSASRPYFDTRQDYVLALQPLISLERRHHVHHLGKRDSEVDPREERWGPTRTHLKRSIDHVRAAIVGGSSRAVPRFTVVLPTTASSVEQSRAAFGA